MTTISTSETGSETGRETAQPLSPPPPAKEPGRRRFGAAELALGVAVLALLVAGAAVYAVFDDGAPVTQTAFSAVTEGLERRVGKLEEAGATGPDAHELAQALANLKPRAEAPAVDPRVEEVARRLDETQQKLAAIDAALAESGRRITAEAATSADFARQLQAFSKTANDVASLTELVNGLTVRVEDLRRSAAATQGLVLAAGQLRLALAGDQPFAAEVKAARALSGNDATASSALDALSPYAEKGIPTRAQLTARFAALAGPAVRAAASDGSGDWIDQVKGAVAALVTVRRRGAAPGDDVETVIARAEAELGAGDLVRAADEVAALRGPAASTMASWLADARARLAAETAAGQLADRAVALLGGVGAKP